MSYTGNCPNCGYMLQLGPGIDKGFCSRCGSHVQISDPNKVNIQLSGKISVDGVAEIAKLKDAAKNKQSVGKVIEAGNLWGKVVAIDPTDGEAYIGLCHVELFEMSRRFESELMNGAMTRGLIPAWCDEVFTDSTNYYMAQIYAEKPEFEKLEQIFRRLSQGARAEQQRIMEAKNRREAEEERRAKGRFWFWTVFVMINILGIALAIVGYNLGINFLYVAGLIMGAPAIIGIAIFLIFLILTSK